MRFKEINGVARGEIESGDMSNAIENIAKNDDSPLDILGFGDLPKEKTEELIFDTKKAIENIDNAINKSPGIPNNTVLHRGFGSEDIYDLVKNKTISTGSIFQDKGFMSTSLNKITAERFSNKKYPVLLEILADKNAKGILLSTETIGSAFRNEAEMLLPRNSKLIIVSSNIEKDKYGREIAKIIARYK
jgi:hypothetical protein